MPSRTSSRVFGHHNGHSGRLARLRGLTSGSGSACAVGATAGASYAPLSEVVDYRGSVAVAACARCVTASSKSAERLKVETGAISGGSARLVGPRRIVGRGFETCRDATSLSRLEDVVH